VTFLFFNHALAVYMEETSETNAHYLGIFHAQSKEGEYLHFAYRFASQPPFEILQVSEQLPLLGRRSSTSRYPFAFATGLVVIRNTVFIAYGSGDRESRLLAMNLEELDSYFC
jgi:hypothetical protein